jgi:preprotein translocase subunit SecG
MQKSADHRRAALRQKITRARKLARLDRFVIVIGLLWLVTSVALLFLSAPAHSRPEHATASHNVRVQPHLESSDSFILLGV